MKVTNETLTAEVKAEIASLIEAANNYDGGCMITSHRYAVKGNFVYDNNKGLMPIKVTRYIHNYGSGVVSVQDLVDGCPQYSKDAILKAGLTPVSERDIAKYGKVARIVIDDNNGRRIYTAE